MIRNYKMKRKMYGWLGVLIFILFILIYLISMARIFGRKELPVKTETENIEVKISESFRVRTTESNPVKTFDRIPVKSVPMKKVRKQFSNYTTNTASIANKLLKCDSRISLVVAINSFSENMDYRESIRKSWGQPGAWKNKARIIFFTGWSEQLKDEVTIESKKYRDMLFIDGYELYRHLPNKIISIMEWIRASCPKVRAVIKVDDDVFLNVPNILELTENRDLNGKFIYGRLAVKWVPDRDEESKYYVTDYEFGYDVYPNFVTGPAYVISMSALSAILDTAMTERPDLRLMPLEDVYLTGIVAEKCGVQRIHVEGFQDSRVPLNPCNVNLLKIIHGVQYFNLEVAWAMVGKKPEELKKPCKKKICISEFFNLCAIKPADYSISLNEYYERKKL